MNDILTRLQNGESIDDIAADFTKMLNEASAAYEAEIKAQKEAEKEAAAKAHKIDILRAISELFTEYITSFYPDFKIDGKSVDELFSSDEMTDEDYLEMGEMIDSFLELASSPIFSMTVPSKQTTKSNTKPSQPNVDFLSGKNLDNIFDAFFTTHKL